MNRADLLHALQQHRVRPDCYDLEGGLLDERYCLGRERGLWMVYYSERGLKIGSREFMAEDDACRYFLDLVTSDPSTRA